MPRAKYHIERKCKICGTLFLAKNIDSVYCSRRCSNAGYRIRKREEKVAEKLKAIVGQIPEKRQYISIKEAVAIYGVSKGTLYRLIRKCSIPYINIGIRIIRISCSELENRFQPRVISQEPKTTPKLYSLEPSDCYTVGEISKKYKICPSTVYASIRRNSIPIRQIGNYVYVPKAEIDKLFH